jgi:hypothetical protein
MEQNEFDSEIKKRLAKAYTRDEYERIRGMAARGEDIDEYDR